MKSLTLNGLTVAVERKRIKNMYIRVYPPDGGVRITAPLRATDAAIRRFVESRAAWVEKQREKIARLPVDVKLACETGETCLLWGGRYRLEVAPAPRNEAFIDGNRIVLRVREGGAADQRAAALGRFYREELARAIPSILKKCERIIGVRAREWRIRDMKTRWGTCNARDGRIWLNLRLAQKPPECLEYVIVHELVHLLERGHNAVFRAYMDRFYPNWKEVRKTLNGIGGET
jgi:predicted metal-dependent hydrolase